MTQRDYCNARANAGDGQAMLRYLSRRREMVRDQDRDGQEQEREQLRKLEPASGSERELEEGLQWREKKEREVSYMSVVISPERQDTKLRDEDWHRIAQLWANNRNGKEERHVSYVHRDTDHEHMHLAVARSYYSKAEYQRNKDQTREIIRERERDRDQQRMIDRIHEREAEREREREQQRERDRDQERNQDHEKQPERAPERDR